jgi:hypothetical protein
MTVEEIQKIADKVWDRMEKTQSFVDLFSKLAITGDKDVDKMIIKTVCDIAVGETIRTINEPSAAQALHFNQYD